MKSFAHLCLPLGLALLSSLPSLKADAQENVTVRDTGTWRAVSNTARSVTGDVILTPDKLYINFSGFTLAQIRHLQPAEVLGVFNADENEDGAGNLYRLNIPAEKKFLHKSTLCGAEDTTYMATYVVGKDLQVAFFSSAAIPKMTAEALAGGSNLCGTYQYHH